MADFALAVDIGGTKVEAALVTAEGVLVAESRARRPTGPDTTVGLLHAAVSDVVRDALPALPDGSMIVGAGIGSAGPVDLPTGTISPVNMPGAHGFAVVETVAELLAEGGVAGTPVILRHDGGALALAEAWKGATAGARASMSIVVSTGVGGGFVVGGRPMSGASGNAGHLGQTRAEAGGGLTLEEVASGPSSAAWARAQGWTGSTGEDLARDAAAGDRVARAAIERSAEAVGRALADAATLVDLEIIAIGGGFSRVSADYVELVAAAAGASAALPYSRATRIVRTALGDEGPLLGAAALVIAPARGTSDG
ncbi:ROK family protein [Microbacterium rhizomatis]|uniref:ROK family protein n=1 Tax=Microbacterium rhizomatis TaxID=1631477 RepID=A0A5J5J1V7_9MICO|nr:ROK family protein [Microbacterium rhizomatis]KAA9108357.1 ROK family protein [Microbacterium rhizomatis]